MKKNLYIVLFATLLFSSCEKFVDNLNDDPNNFSDAPPELMIVGPQLANMMICEGELGRIAGIFSSQFTGYDRQYLSIQNYSMVAADFDNIWGTLYADGIAQCRIIESKAAVLKNTELLGVAQVIEANLVGQATALWGDIPFTEACNAESFPQPKYDSQLSVYANLITLLDAAIGNLGTAPGHPYAGQTVVENAMDWTQVAHTLKARFYLHQKKYAEAITEASLGISSADGSWLANHENEGTDGKWNLYYGFLDWHRGGYMTSTDAYLPKLLNDTLPESRGNAKTNEAGRQAFYFMNDYYSPIDPNMDNGIFAYNAPFILVGYEENELILAEAYSRTGDDIQALAHLNNVRAYLNTLYSGNYLPYIIADFGPAGIAGGSSISAGLQMEILEEKYICLFGQLEAFTDLRRTKNQLGIPLNTGTTLPQRFLYPQTEINSNTNTPTGLTMFTPTTVNQ